MRRIAVKHHSIGLFRGALTQASSVLNRRNWDMSPHLAVPCGWVNMKTGEVHSKGNPHLWATRKTAVAPDEGSPELFLKTLGECLPAEGMVDYMQRWFGYCLTTDMSAKKFHIWVGEGDNGKSVILDTIKKVMGDKYARSINKKAILVQRNPPHDSTIAVLKGARLGYCAEVEDGVLDASRIKAITGGDALSANFMRGNPFDFQPQFKVILTSNKMPQIASVDYAFACRIHLVDWTVKFEGDEKNEGLADELESELGQIFSWMIEGAMEYKRHGLNPPESVTAASDMYIRGEDTISQWYEECVEVEPGRMDSEVRLLPLLSKLARGQRLQEEDAQPNHARKVVESARSRRKTREEKRRRQTPNGEVGITAFEGR